MDARDYKIAKELKERLRLIVPLIDLRVFGSRARGMHEQYSDMDVFIEVTSLDEVMKNAILEVVWEVGFENFMVISPIVYTKEEVEKSPLRSSPLIQNIMEEGVRI